MVRTGAVEEEEGRTTRLDTYGCRGHYVQEIGDARGNANAASEDQLQAHVKVTMALVRHLRPL
jgi:hypothetical protein